MLHTRQGCRVLSGSVSPLLSPSLFSASQGEISSSGFTLGPWLLGERPHHMWSTHKEWKMCLCGNRLLEVGLPASWHNSSPNISISLPRYAIPLWADFSVFCTDRCLMLRWRSWKPSFCTFKVIPSQSWANLSLLYFSDTHMCGCSVTFSRTTWGAQELWFSCVSWQLKVVGLCQRSNYSFLGHSGETAEKSWCPCLCLNGKVGQLDAHWQKMQLLTLDLWALVLSMGSNL